MSAVEIPQLRVKPPEAIEQAVMDRLVADLLGQLQSLPEQRQRRFVVALAGEGDPLDEQVEQQRDEEVMLPGQDQTLGL